MDVPNNTANNFFSIAQIIIILIISWRNVLYNNNTR